ncbi:MAG TPA: hemin uptake protein HemP [Burkholderiales bacterium]|jgi:hemin uptake protein HemP|nr:hemin uptake protein HemP [Burkholderiales bacterium]
MQTTNSNHAAQKASHGAPVRPDHVAPPAVSLTTEALFAGAREIALLHNGRQYRLRITQQGKLLLTA